MIEQFKGLLGAILRILILWFFLIPFSLPILIGLFTG